MSDSRQQRMNPPCLEEITESIQTIRDYGFILSSLKKIRLSTLKCSFQEEKVSHYFWTDRAAHV